MKTRFLLFPLALLILLVAAACGGGGDSSGSSEDEAQIEDAIVKSVTLGDPSKCTEYMTQNFLEQNGEGKGKAALEECEEEAEDTSDNPEKVTVTDIQVDGENATANAAFVGSPLDGQTIAVALVKEDGGWKLDELEGFAELDQDVLAEAAEEGLAGEVTDEQLSCIGDVIREAPEDELQAWVLEGDGEGFGKAIEAACE